MHIATLDNWSLLTDPDPYKAPEQLVATLAGNVTNHPRHEDGKYIRTSRLIGKRGQLVLTQNTTYDLGTVDPAYEKTFPNARERLLAALEEVA